MAEYDRCTEHDQLKPCPDCDAIFEALRLPNPGKRTERRGEQIREDW